MNSLQEKTLQDTYDGFSGILDGLSFQSSKLAEVVHLHDLVVELRDNLFEAFPIEINPRADDVLEIGDGMTDAEADADTLRSAGWGTDEDYGG